MTNEQIHRNLGYISALNLQPYSDMAKDYLLDEELDAYEMASDFMEASEVSDMPILVIDLVLEVLEELAGQGDENALNDLGVFWLLGLGGRKDEPKARDYFRKAVLFGSRQALENLGFAALNDGDYETAYKSFVKGALLMEPFAYYQLALMYERGQFVDKNPTQAFEMFYTLYRNLNDSSAAFLGPELCVKLAECFLDGQGCEKDVFLAVDFLDEAQAMLEIMEDWDDARYALFSKVRLLSRQAAHQLTAMINRKTSLD